MAPAGPPSLAKAPFSLRAFFFAAMESFLHASTSASVRPPALRTGTFFLGTCSWFGCILHAVVSAEGAWPETGVILSSCCCRLLAVCRPLGFKLAPLRPDRFDDSLDFAPEAGGFSVCFASSSAKLWRRCRKELLW